MSATRSGFCFGPDKPHMHQKCNGTFNPGAGEMKSTGVQKCWCDCHDARTVLHGQVHGADRRPGFV